jgi:hypothetical protein
MANYWLVIMPAAFLTALAVWIWLVFRADRRQTPPAQESSPRREVIGGAFRAREGGRQVMPDPHGPLQTPPPGPSSHPHTS